MAKEKETYSLISVDVASEEEVVRVDPMACIEASLPIPRMLLPS